MKIEDSVVELSQYKNVRAGSLRQEEANKFVESIYEDLKKLAGTKKGKIIDIQEPGDEPWPTADQFRSMDVVSKIKITKRVVLRTRLFKIAMKRKTHPGFKYTPANNYIGGGKVVFWWRFKRSKSKIKSNGTTGSK